MIPDKKIGVWGFGIVGKAACDYLYTHTTNLEVLNAKELTKEEQTFLSAKNISWHLQETHLYYFLEHNDYIVPSPGIDLRPYSTYKHKWITELDLLHEHFKKTVIAVTGSVGKTSITSILSQLLGHNDLRWYTGGNIGAGMLELLKHEIEFDAALLEVSSFQLENCRTFAPQLAIWTNFYPNHLDRHGTMQAYFDAKYTMIDHQKSDQCALLPFDVIPYLAHKKPQSKLNFFTTHHVSHKQLQHLPPKSRLFCLEQEGIVVYEQSKRSIIYQHGLPTFSFKENWLIIISALHILHHDLAKPDYVQKLQALCDTITLPEHRLEKIHEKNGFIVYNDSKSTTIESTQAAVNQLIGGAPITLFLGGLCKGVNREPLIKGLRDNVLAIYCFGKEAEQLQRWADAYGIPASSFATLDAAVAACVHNTKEPAQILFSPSGSSYDLFKDYVERGNYFKKLILNANFAA